MIVLGKIFAIVGAIIAVLMIPFILQILISKKYKEYGIKTLVVFGVIFLTAVIFSVIGYLMMIAAWNKRKTDSI